MSERLRRWPDCLGEQQRSRGTRREFQSTASDSRRNAYLLDWRESLFDCTFRHPAHSYDTKRD